MFKIFFIIFLLGHVVGDYYFQTTKIAIKKEIDRKYLYYHGILYTVAMLLVVLPIRSMLVLLVAIGMGVLHGVIDYTKWQYKKRTAIFVREERNVYIVDQILHIVCIVLGAYIMARTQKEVVLYPAISMFFDTIGISYLDIYKSIWVVLMIHKPTNITISKILFTYKPIEKQLQQQKKEDYQAGRFIGTLERFIIYILLTVNQFSAIGLVLTAKSIARYDEISKEHITAEYYLLGTLLSVLSAFIIVIISTSI